MAVYKVIQDIEAEDKLLGPLTLKGFIYAVVAGFLIFINVRIAIASSGGGYRFIAIFILIWPALLFAVLASPLGREQPTEVWLLSHVMFFLKPHARVWHEQGPLNNVTITAPKKEELPVKNLSTGQIHSRLETLALTMDSRGWAIKNAYPNQASSPPPFSYLNSGQAASDRLVKRDYPDKNPISDVHPSEDVLDLENSPRAKHVENLLQKKTLEQKEARLAKLDQERQKLAAAPAAEPEHKAKPKISVRHDALPAKQQVAPAAPVQPAKPPAAVLPKLQSLAHSANDITVASVASLANHPTGPRVTKIAPGEVEIKLH